MAALLLLTGVVVVVSSDLGAPTAASWCGPVPAAARPPHLQPVKKGIGTWWFSGVNAALAGTRLGWYYTWKSGRDRVDPPAGAEFVPMIWGADNVNAEDLTAAAAAGSTVLGFNEPDVSDQANLTVAQALQLWPRVVATGRRIGSPAVSANASTPGSWLDRFMSGAGQAGLRVDFLALHWYGSDFTDPAAATRSLCRYLASAYDRYQKPIWLTEFALADFTRGVASAVYPTAAEQEAFVSLALPMLDGLPFVERYAWFALSDSGSGYRTGLYSDATTLTPAGAEYFNLDR